MKHNLLLAFSFAKREFFERYLGTSIGQLWYLIYPIIMILIYTIIFSDFMKMKLDIVNNAYSYSIYLVPGILAWMSFSKMLIRLSNIFSEKENFLKKINVPAYVFLLSVSIIEGCLLGLSFLLALFFLIIVDHTISLNFLFLLPILGLQILFTFALGTILAILTAFFKDLKEAIPIIIQLYFWMTPIIYMKEMLADKYPLLLVFNPFYYFIQQYQNIFVYNQLPRVQEFLVLLTMTFMMLILAMYLYKKSISTIKDIL